MDYQRTTLKQTLVVDKLITMYYFEFAKNYMFHGEQHDFWEFVYIDKGEVDVTADSRRHLLKSGMIIFHKPNEFHRFHACNGTAPNIVVISFECKSPAMKQFEQQVLSLETEERNLLASMVNEGMNAFEFPFHHPLVRRDDSPIGSEQLVRVYLESFLLRLLRKFSLPFGKPKGPALAAAAKEKADYEVVQHALHFMQQNIDSPLSLSDISHSLHVARTKLKDLFKEQTGEPIMRYFTSLRMEHAKMLIREQAYNFTEISSQLGFSSPHYFSKSFKKITGMTPSEYARSVKARSSAAPLGKLFLN
ncbi:AraC family transcriptional regulator [Paenibacillus agricola]|uniref:AraC family transcriptional regulator n=1 Tax=Paenibacillus agricola TaxID=2716264 RepID=A0ABX0JB13_9BACL|nr:AraC family transcriptional regulator [Paenibacillus agricola]NHN32461.1 AraC family transcriptional regulator [Paenibacillus agricola]